MNSGQHGGEDEGEVEEEVVALNHKLRTEVKCVCHKFVTNTNNHGTKSERFNKGERKLSHQLSDSNDWHLKSYFNLFHKNYTVLVLHFRFE